MANKNAPFGLQSDQRIGSAEWRASLTMYRIPAWTTDAIYTGDPVRILPGASSNAGIESVTLVSDTGPITGVVAGFEGMVTANTAVQSGGGYYGAPVGNAFRPSATTQDYYVLVAGTDNQFVAQANGLLAVSDIGSTFNLAPAAGNQISGSGYTVSTSAVSGGQVKVLSAVSNPTNDPLSANAKYVVAIANVA
jgi:hypothetical protein